MDKLKQLQAEYLEKDARLKALFEKDEEGLSAEEQAEAVQLDAACEQLKVDIEAEKAERAKVTDARARLQSRDEWANETPTDAARLQTQRTPLNLGHGSRPGGAEEVQSAVASAQRHNRVTSFKARDGKSAEERAYRFGMWFLATSAGLPRAQKFCREHGIPLQFLLKGSDTPIQLTHKEGVNATGGFLVPPEFENDLIDLREEYGVFRRNAKVTPMRSDTKSVPRRTGGLTAYPAGESTAGTESDKGWDRVELTARKWIVLARYTSELDEDAVIDIGNDLAEEMAYAFSNKEDECGFNGDGTSTYHGIVGACPKIKGLSGTIANIAGLVVASGNAYSEIVLSDFNNVKAKLPRYARKGNVKWYASQGFYHSVMEKLALAAGGVTAAEIAAGRNVEYFMGYPVEIAQVLPSVEANSQVCALFGDLRMAALFGDRRMSTIAISEHAAFESDELMIRGTTRFDINVHDVGNADATAGLRKPGPIVGLITAAS